MRIKNFQHLLTFSFKINKDEACVISQGQCFPLSEIALIRFARIQSQGYTSTIIAYKAAQKSIPEDGLNDVNLLKLIACWLKYSLQVPFTSLKASTRIQLSLQQIQAEFKPLLCSRTQNGSKCTFRIIIQLKISV